MSRYDVEAKDPGKYTIVVGWDKSLQTYFAQVTRKDLDRDWDMALWKGTNPREINSIAELQTALKPYAEIPKETQNALAFDMGPADYYSGYVRNAPRQEPSKAIIPDHAEYDR
jgi:hypothetical protein